MTSTIRWAGRTAMAIAVALLPTLASAQTAANGTSATPAPPATTAPLTWSWTDGFIAQANGGDYRLQLGTITQVDGRFSLDDSSPVIDTFSIRKARLVMAGRVARYFDFRLVPDFGNGSTTLADAYLDTRFSNAFRVRVGKDKAPIGYELLIGDAFVLFPERALASSLVPNRDIGFQAQGDFAGGRLTYSAGVFNGIPDGSSSTTELDTNNGKDLAGRIVVQPFRAGGKPVGPLQGLGFHLGASTGTQQGSLPTFRTGIGQSYFTYAAGTVADGRRTRVAPTVFYYRGPFGAFGEYIRSKQQVTRLVTTDVANDAWEVTASYVVTGETATDRGVRPRASFDPPNHHWGAVQLLARCSELTVDEAAFDAGFAGAGASRSATACAAGVNWYPTTAVKWYASYERTRFEGGLTATRQPEHALTVRAQVAF